MGTEQLLQHVTRMSKCTNVFFIAVVFAIAFGSLLIMMFFGELQESTHIALTRGRTVYEYIEGELIERVTTCHFRFKPALFVADKVSVRVVWETSYCGDANNPKPVTATASIVASDSEMVPTANATHFKFSARRDVFNARILHSVCGSDPITIDVFTQFSNTDVLRYVHQFKLPPCSLPKTSVRSPLSTFRVGVVGDSQAGAPIFRHILYHLAKRKPTLLIHVGDVVQSATVTREWRSYFFSPLQNAGISSTIPLAVAWGNHDVGDGSERAASAYLSDRRFAFTAGGIRFVILDSLHDSNEQLEWLSNELQSEEWTNARFRVAGTHIPPYIEFWEPRAWTKGESEWGRFVRDKHLPLLLQAKCDLVMGGHSHLYQRGKINDTWFLIVGGAGGSTEDKRVENYGMYTVTSLVHHYGMLEATPCTLQWRAFNHVEEQMDEFHINRC